MPAEIISDVDGVVTLRVSGELTQPELAASQKRCAEIMQERGKVRVLILIENYKGTARGGNWGDISFQSKHDSQIERMAIVGEKAKEDLVLLFVGQGLRKFPIEYFTPAQRSQAETWVLE